MPDGPNYGVTKRHAVPFEWQRSPGGDSDTYYKERYTPDLVNASLVVKFTWDDSVNGVLDFIGEHQKHGANITRFNPEPHPYLPGLYCVGMDLVRNLGTLTYEPSQNNAPRYEWVEY